MEQEWTAAHVEGRELTDLERELKDALVRCLQYIQVAHHDAKLRGASEGLLDIAKRDYEFVEAALAKASGK